MCALIKLALDRDPENADAIANLQDMQASDPSLVAGTAQPASRDAAVATGAGTLNSWVTDALDAAHRIIGLSGMRVLEVGGSVPPEAVRRLGVAKWVACDLATTPCDEDDYQALHADARALPQEAESFDAAYSVCAFEHFDGIDAVLSEIHRTLRPGGRLFTQFAPIWSSSIGHHVWIIENGRNVVTFNDNVIPHWGHLLLEEHELRNYLTVVRSAPLAEQICNYISVNSYINRVFEAEFRWQFQSSRFVVELIEPWGGHTSPGAQMLAALRQRWPEGGDFAAHGLRVVLKK